MSASVLPVSEADVAPMADVGRKPAKRTDLRPYFGFVG